ncbi:hypothetical protein L7F22_028596 [Adiantum nelumboides]|nr:hypothetical protein [Adiantum nelumboides]
MEPLGLPSPCRCPRDLVVAGARSVCHRRRPGRPLRRRPCNLSACQQRVVVHPYEGAVGIAPCTRRPSAHAVGARRRPTVVHVGAGNAVDGPLRAIVLVTPSSPMHAPSACQRLTSLIPRSARLVDALCVEVAPVGSVRLHVVDPPWSAAPVVHGRRWTAACTIGVPTSAHVVEPPVRPRADVRLLTLSSPCRRRPRSAPPSGPRSVASLKGPRCMEHPRSSHGRRAPARPRYVEPR